MLKIQAITPDGLTGFDEFGQLMTWSTADEDGYRVGNFLMDVRGCTCYICGSGWLITTESLKDQQQVDKLNVHRSCYFGYRKMVEREFWKNSLIDAGYLFNYDEVPPRYPHSTPWRRITVLSGAADRADTGFRLVVGRRKRVWEVRVHGVGDLSAQFTDVDNTKGYSYNPSEEEPEYGPYYYAHAYNKTQVIDYLTRFRLAIPADTDRNTCK